MAIDMKTVKGESSTEFGKSLLSGIQKNNARIMRSEQKRQDKKDWQALGLKAGLTIANSVIKGQTETFLNSTEVTGKNVATKLALENYNSVKGIQDTAQAYDGGEAAYWAHQGRELVRPELTAEFGTLVNKVEHASLLATRGKKVGDMMRQAHIVSLNAGRDFFSRSGGEKTYNDIIKQNRSTTLTGKIGSVISNLVGLTSNEEINQGAENLFDSAKELNKYYDLYNQTKNAPVSVLLATALPKDLGEPVSELGEVVSKTVKDTWNREKVVSHMVVTTIDPETGQKKKHIVNIETQETVSEKAFEEAKHFSAKIAFSAENKAHTNEARLAIMRNVTAEQREAMEDSLDNYIDSMGFGWQGQEEEKNARKDVMNLVYAGLFVNMKTLESQLGIAPQRAAQLSVEMVSMDPSFAGQGAGGKGAGLASPYYTLAAINKLWGAKGTLINKEATERLISSITLATAWKNSSKRERVEIESVLRNIESGDNKQLEGLMRRHKLVKAAEKLRIERPSLSLEESLTIAQKGPF